MLKKIKNRKELILYIIFGGLTTLVSILTQYLADFLGAGTAVATAISWICAVTFAFVVNKLFVFKSRAKWFRQAVAFYGARLTTFFLELGFMLLTVDLLLLNMHVMKVFAQVFVLIGNYLISKYFVFKKS